MLLLYKGVATCAPEHTNVLKTKNLKIKTWKKIAKEIKRRVVTD